MIILKILLLISYSILTKTIDAPSDLKAVELSTHSFSVSWRNFDTKATAFIATIYQLNDGEKTELSKRVDAIKTCLLKYINESFATWTDLIPGKTYKVSVLSIDKTEEISAIVGEDITTRPMPPSKLKALPFMSNEAPRWLLDSGRVDLLENITIFGMIVDWSNPVVGLFDHFLISVYPPHGKIFTRRVKRYTDISTERVVWDLLPGFYYDVIVRSESNGVESEPSSTGLRIPPEKPGTIKIVSVGEDHVFLSWKSPHRGKIDDYIVKLSPPGGNVVVPSNRTEKERVIRNLISGTKYTAKIFSSVDSLLSMNGTSVSFATPPKRPSSRIHLPQIYSNSIILFWQATKGNLDYYQIIYYPTKSRDRKYLKTTNQTITLENLSENTEYTIEVYTASNEIYSLPRTIKAVTKSKPQANVDEAELNYDANMKDFKLGAGGYESDQDQHGMGLKKDTMLISCHLHNFTLYLDKRVIGEYEDKYGPLHFGDGSDPSCYGVRYDTYYRYTIAPNLNMCGTRYEENSTFANFSNNLSNQHKYDEWLKESSDPTNTVIFGKGKPFRQVSMKVWCLFPINVSASLLYNPEKIRNAVQRWSIKGIGEFSAQMHLYKSGLFIEPYKNSPELNIEDNLYVQVKLFESTSSDADLVIRRCWATPSSDHEDKTFYPIIDKSCPIKGQMENKLQILNNGRGQQVRWIGPVFKFIQLNSVWIHCSVKVCFDANCEPNCESSSRSKRDTKLAVDQNIISAGPIRSSQIIPNSTNKPAKGKVDKSEDVFIICIIAFLFVLIFGFSAITICIQWKSKKSKDNFANPIRGIFSSYQSEVLSIAKLADINRGSLDGFFDHEETVSKVYTNSTVSNISQSVADSADSCNSEIVVDSQNIADSVDSSNSQNIADSVDSSNSQNIADSAESSNSQNIADSVDSSNSQNIADSVDSSNSQNVADSVDYSKPQCLDEFINPKKLSKKLNLPESSQQFESCSSNQDSENSSDKTKSLNVSNETENREVNPSVDIVHEL